MTVEPDPAEFVSTDRVVALARSLIACDTQNPPGHEAPVVEPLLWALETLGCDIEVWEAAPGRPSILATYSQGLSESTLLINGHTDVVPALSAGWSAPPFEAELIAGKVYGRGAADMKGGIASAIEGLRACVDAGSRISTKIVFHLVADEEAGGRHGTEALMLAGRIEADACIVPEPTGLNVVVAERGSIMARVRVLGDSGHGSEPEKGHSAIAAAAVMIGALHCGDFYEEAHPLLGRPTCNVALITGGIATNVIAPVCEFVIDRRTRPGEKIEDVLQSIRAKIDGACPDARYELEVLSAVEGSEMPRDHPFPGFVAQAAGTTAGAYVGISLATDARFLRNQLGIPSVIYGPGSIEQAHTTDEWVEVTQLAEAARTFARVFTTFSSETAGPRLAPLFKPEGEM